MMADSSKLLGKETQLEHHTWTGPLIRRAAVVFIATCWLAVGAVTSVVISGGADDERTQQARDGRQSPVNHARILEFSVGTTDQNRLPSPDSSAQIEIVGKEYGTRITIVDPDGVILFESDPTQNVTTIAKGSRIPAMTVSGAPNDGSMISGG